MNTTEFLIKYTLVTYISTLTLLTMGTCIFNYMYKLHIK